MGKLLEIKDLVKYFPTGAGVVHAVDHVDMTLNAGQTIGIVGESGCGKSTLGRCVLNLIPPTSGEVLFEGRNVLSKKTDKKLMRQQMQIIFQDPYSSLDPRKTVFNLIAEPLIVNKMCASKAEMSDRIFNVMEMVGLAERLAGSYPHELDGGRRQRIGIARALVMNPKFVVCDEPVSALDVSIQAQTLNLMMDIQDRLGVAYMFITHDLSVVKHISNDIVVMYLGEVVEQAPKNEIFSNPVHPYTKALLSAVPIADASRRHKKKELIQGEVTSPIDPKPGCRFYARCPHACEKCLEPTELAETGEGHFVRCCRWKEL